MKFVIDRKLDNERMDISFTLIKFSFRLNYTEILREEIKYKSYSGYCLDAVQKPNESGFNSVSIDRIGVLQIMYSRSTHNDGKIWEIYCYPEEEEQALQLIKIDIKKYALNHFLNTLTLIQTVK